MSDSPQVTTPTESEAPIEARRQFKKNVICLLIACVAVYQSWWVLLLLTPLTFNVPTEYILFLRWFLALLCLVPTIAFGARPRPAIRDRLIFGTFLVFLLGALYSSGDERTSWFPFVAPGTAAVAGLAFLFGVALAILLPRACPPDNAPE